MTLIEKLLSRETNHLSFLFEEVEKDITETEAFKKWFGDSKVVDDLGKLLVMYQGRTTKGLTNLTNNGQGWFTRSRNTAVLYADINYHNDQVQRDNEQIFDTVTNDELRGEVYSAYLDIKNPLTVSIRKTFGDRLKENPIIEKAKEDGYDGVLFVDDDESIISAVVFYPEQIKIIT